MDFIATTSIDDQILSQYHFSTNDQDFLKQVHRFLVDTGIAVEEHFMLKILTHTDKYNWNGFSLTEEIVLTISFGDIYNPRKLTGTCQAKHRYTIKAADPGIYKKQLIEISYRIPDLLLPNFMEFFDFIDWGI